MSILSPDTWFLQTCTCTDSVSVARSLRTARAQRPAGMSAGVGGTDGRASQTTVRTLGYKRPVGRDDERRVKRSGRYDSQYRTPHIQTAVVSPPHAARATVVGWHGRQPRCRTLRRRHTNATFPCGPRYIRTRVTFPQSGPRYPRADATFPRGYRYTQCRQRCNATRDCRRKDGVRTTRRPACRT